MGDEDDGVAGDVADAVEDFCGTGERRKSLFLSKRSEKWKQGQLKNGHERWTSQDQGVNGFVGLLMSRKRQRGVHGRQTPD